MPMTSKALQRVLLNLWTTQDIIRKTGVTAMTVHLWRKHKGLPHVIIRGSNRPAVRFIPQEVRDWCKRNKVTIAKGK